MARSAGYEIVRTPSLRGFLQSRHVDTVIDVGANIGQFASNLRRSGYDGQIISFEPIGSVFDQLSKRFANDKLWRGFQLALGNKACSDVINVSKNPVYSSLKAQTNLAHGFDPNARYVRSETIKIARLDDIFSTLGGNVVFLKVDTQGFERQVLEGSENSLQSIVGIQLELPIEHLYENTWEFHESIEFMKSLGFTLSQIRPINVLQHDPMSIMEVDCIFSRDK